MTRTLLFALPLAVLIVRPAYGTPPGVATSSAAAEVVPTAAEVVPTAAEVVPTVPGSGPRAAPLELGLDDLESPPEVPPIWARGWFWGLTSAVVVAAVIGSVVAARAGPRCFCITPAGTPCATCD